MNINVKLKLFNAFICTTFFLVSISCSNPTDENIEYDFVKKFGIGNIKMSKTVYCNPNYTYPKQTYIEITGSNNELEMQIKKLGLVKYSKQAANKNRELLPNEYDGKQLWKFSGATSDCLSTNNYGFHYEDCYAAF